MDKFRKFLLPVLPALAGPAVAGCSQDSHRPDVLFILVDDMQAGAIAALGNPDTVTPNIDSLCNEGTVFTDAYTSGALCGALSMPSRAMLMTGRHLFEIQSDGLTIPKAHVTMPEYFRAAGYRTFATGKWHSDKASFARSFSCGDNIFFGGMHPYEDGGHTAPHLYHFDPSGKYDAGMFIGDRFSSEMFADAAISFIEKASKEPEPFMAYVAFSSPHDPRNVLPDYGQKYSPDTLSVPESFLPQHPFDNGELDIRDELILPPPRTPEQIKREMSMYYGMVSEVDFQLGRVLAALRRSGRQDNTVIVFASDNGLAMGRNGLLGKQSLYDHSVGVPLVIVDPRHPGHRETDALCLLSDLFPTLCGMAGLPVPDSVTGHSLLPVIEGRSDAGREDLFLAYSNLQRAVVHDGYKYIIYNVGGRITEQLFDLSADSWEQENLSVKMPQKKEQMKSLLRQRMKENNDFCDLDNPLWWKDGHKLTWDELVSLYVF